MRLARPLVALALVLATASAHAQVITRTPRPRTPGQEPATRSLKARIGVEPAARLLRSPHFEDRLRGIRRAGALATPDMLALLAQSVDPGGPARTDGRLLLEVARALAPHASHAFARAALMTVLNLPTPAAPMRPTSASTREGDLDGDGPARFALARSVAALALAQEETSQGDDALATAARGGGAGAAAALLALEAYPPERVFLLATGAMTAGIAEVAGRMADLRLLDALRAGARSPEAPVRAASLEALARLGDARVVEAARPAKNDGDAHVRRAAAAALLRIGDPDAKAAVLALLDEDETLVAGARLTEGLASNGVTEALVTRLAATKVPRLRRALVEALGHRNDEAAVRALATEAQDPQQAGADAAFALARSPAKSASRALEGLATLPQGARRAVRAHALRGLLRGEGSAALDDLARKLAHGTSELDRAVGVLALVALGKERPEAWLVDPTPAVRRAAAMGAQSTRAKRAPLLAAYASESDEAVRVALAGALVAQGGEGLAGVAIPLLEARLDAGAADAALAVEALGSHARGALWPKVKSQLAAIDPLRRAAAARALGRAPEPEASGLLAAAYRRETSAFVRHAVLVGLTARHRDDGQEAPCVRDTLELAARFDPESALREDARRALAGLPTTGDSGGEREATFLTLDAAPGAMPAAMTGVVFGADGASVPIAFDDEGFALVGALPPGEARLVLAPRFASYESPPP